MRGMLERCPTCQEPMTVKHTKTNATGSYRTFICTVHGKWTSSPLDPMLRRPGVRAQERHVHHADKKDAEKPKEARSKAKEAGDRSATKKIDPRPTQAPKRAEISKAERQVPQKKAKPEPRIKVLEPACPSTRSRIEDIHMARSLGITVAELLG